jgi:hypothetical protein
MEILLFFELRGEDDKPEFKNIQTKIGHRTMFAYGVSDKYERKNTSQTP